VRIDRLLVERGLVESRERARRLVMAGAVLVDDRPVTKPGTEVPDAATVRLRGPDSPYVSRGGEKLAGALDAFGLDVRGVLALDVGASTGGFTDCLLQRGAERVVAVDVGYGQLAWRLRQDPRVVVIERTNARTLTPASLDCPVDLAVVDVSFISLKLALPPLFPLVKDQIVALIKPQFEAGRAQVGKGGVVRDPAVHRQVLDDLAEWSRSQPWRMTQVIVSPIKGPAGNVEFLSYWLPAGIISSGC
jgi:23S rRNA (cytidine1920-2'-O)/16S rRNA (cytidine1409-2'-O)-methyltransferase